MNRLEGRVAIVTGASSGIGAAIARSFAREGAKVALAARRADALGKVAAGIGAAGGTSIVHATDVTREEDVEALFRATDEKLGSVDLLVNCAGIVDHTPTDQLSLARWREMIDTNLTSAFLCSRAALQRMKPKKRGRIIMIGSIAAKMPRPDAMPYTVTKAALDGMARSIAMDGRAYGVTASVMHPGSTVSNLSPDMADRPATICLAVDDVADLVTLIANLPDSTNLFESVIIPIEQPFLGRG